LTRIQAGILDDAMVAAATLKAITTPSMVERPWAPLPHPQLPIECVACKPIER
jgi:hypothetical protein